MKPVARRSCRRSCGPVPTAGSPAPRLPDGERPEPSRRAAEVAPAQGRDVFFGRATPTTHGRARPPMEEREVELGLDPGLLPRVERFGRSIGRSEPLSRHRFGHGMRTGRPRTRRPSPFRPIQRRPHHRSPKTSSSPDLRMLALLGRNLRLLVDDPLRRARSMTRAWTRFSKTAEVAITDTPRNRSRPRAS